MQGNIDHLGVATCSPMRCASRDGGSDAVWPPGHQVGNVEDHPPACPPSAPLGHQCSNFVIHRIQNPDDLTQIRQRTPFIAEAVLKRLPSLPKQNALMFVNLPTTFKVKEAKPLPKSDDARIKELWFHEEGRPVSIELAQVKQANPAQGQVP